MVVYHVLATAFHEAFVGERGEMNARIQTEMAGMSILSLL